MSRAFDTAYADGGVPTWDIGRPQPAVVRLVEDGAFGDAGATVLDAGCGTGEHSLLLAAIGHPVVGVDVAAEAIRRARAKASVRSAAGSAAGSAGSGSTGAAGTAPRFLVHDALDLGALVADAGRPFDAIGPFDAARPFDALAADAARPFDALVADAGRPFDAIRPFDAALDVGLFHTFSDEDRPRYAASLATAVRPGGRAFVLCWSDRNPFGYGPRRVTRREIRATFRASAGWRVDRIDDEELVSRLPGGRIHAWLVRLVRRP